MKKRRVHLVTFRVLLFLIIFLIPLTVSAIQRSGDNPPKWPHEASELLPDPDITYGRLPNGFGYVLMENREPKNRVSMHLIVQAGSLHERNDERGLAHFLEHLVFCGSENFKPGELVKYFQSIGMQFGGDANAHTSFDETVYDIVLPKGGKKDLDKGLLVLHDYAAGALLLPEEIDRERNVVLAEKRTRDSASYRTFIAALKFEFAHSRISKRIPIGIEKVLKHAGKDRLKRYYDTWYRPDNMMVVIVGDFDTAVAEKLIRDRFAGMAPRAAAQPEPDIGKVNHPQQQAFYHYEKEAGNTTVKMEMIRKVPKVHDSLFYQTMMLKRLFADYIIQDRLDSLLNKQETPFTTARIASGRYLEEIEYAEISAECRPDDWKNTLQLIEKTVRSALMYGVTPVELDIVKKKFYADLEKNVRGAKTRNSQELAGRIIWHINNDRVLQSPQQEKEIFEPIIRAMSVADINTAFKENWGGDNPLFLVTGNAFIPGNTPSMTIVKAVTESRKDTVSPQNTKKVVPFPYLALPQTTGKISDKRMVPEVDIIQIDFENRIRLNLKKTDFKDNEVLACVTFGQGKYSEPEEKPGLAELSMHVVNESGLGKLKKNEMEWALAGKNTSFMFKVDEDCFSYQMASVSDELELLFQVIYTLVQDPVFRPDAYRLAMDRFFLHYQELTHTIDGAMVLSGAAFLAGGDSRFGLPAYTRFRTYTIEDIKQWIIPELYEGALEVSVVGDFEVERLLALASTYLGTLSMRNPLQERNDPRKVNHPGNKKLDLAVMTKIPKGRVHISYPTDDFWNIKRNRRLNVLSQIFSEKMRENIREKLGATYSPYAYNLSSRAYRGYGVFNTVVDVDPSASDRVVTEVKNIAQTLKTNGVTEKELHMALDPVLTRINDLVRTNEYWLQSVLKQSREFPQQLDWCRTFLSDHAAITTQEISGLAKKYLDNRHTAVITIIPIEKKE